MAPGPQGGVVKAIRAFGTMTADLLALADWLAEQGVTVGAMESTGVYWKPVWNLLEGSFTLLLVNAHHIKTVPGRKTDVRDCEWIADLLRHGLLRASFVPDRPQRELRELTRYRTTLIRDRTAEVNRLQQTLEGANIKLASVASDVLGVSGRAMLAALVEGTPPPALLADLARGRRREKRGAVERALTGRFAAHQRFLVAEHLTRIDSLNEAIERVSAAIAARVRPYEDAITRLDAIPGLGRRTAEILVAEIGVAMSRFPSARHLARWAGMCPGNNESAGKRKSGRTRKANPWLRAALVEAGQAASHTKDTALVARYQRLVGRRGKKKAIVALGHRILTYASHLLATGAPFHDLGPHYFDVVARQRVERRLVQRLEGLGYKVSLEPAV
jgi:transposase